MEVSVVSKDQAVAAFEARLEAASADEDAIFVVAEEIESSSELDEHGRSQLVARAQALIDGARKARGVGPDATISQLAAAFDGPPPAPLDAVKRDYPPEAGFNVASGLYFERIAGRTRVIPTVTIETQDGSRTTLFPCLPLRERRRAGGG